MIIIIITNIVVVIGIICRNKLLCQNAYSARPGHDGVGKQKALNRAIRAFASVYGSRDQDIL